MAAQAQPTLTREQQLAWEQRHRKHAGFAAIAAAVLLFFTTTYEAAVVKGRGNRSDDVLRKVHDKVGLLYGITALQVIAYGLLALVLVYLYRAMKFRRPEAVAAAYALAIGAPVAIALATIFRQVELVHIAGQFASSKPNPDAHSIIGASDYLRAVEDLDPIKRAENLLTHGVFVAVAIIGYASSLALGFALILVSSNARRAGLLSGAIGIVGVIVGVLTALPIIPPQVLQLFWLGAVALIILDRWPGGRGPAWAAGEAMPWPRVADQRAEIQRRRAELAGDQPADGAGGADAPPEPARPASRKRKRKKKR